MKKIRRFIKNLGKKVLLAVVTFVIFSIPVMYLFLLNANKASAAWYNDNWVYRQAITVTVTSNSSDITNLQTLLTVNTSTLISASKLQSSCQDLRFTNVSGNLLPYYIDPTPGCNSATTKIWVMADLIPKNTTTYTIYMYYGNPSAPTASNAQPYFDNLVGLVGYWTMNDGSGTTSKDSSVKGNDGTLSGSTIPTWISSCQYNNCLSFNGSTAYSSIGNPANLQLTTGTLEAWIKTSNAGAGYRGVIVKNSAYNVFLKDNVLITYDEGAATDRSTGINIADNTWHQLAVTFKSGVANGTVIYLDGVAKFTTTMTVSNQSSILTIGENISGGQNFSGSIDDTKVYNTARNAAQIANDYTNKNSIGQTYNIATTAVGTSVPATSFASEETFNGNNPGPLSYWKFNEGSGTTTSDSTGQNNTATLAGGTSPSWQTEDMCVSGKCLYLDGATSNLTVANAIKGIQTVSLWVKPVSFGSGGALIDFDGGTNKITYNSSGVLASTISSSTVYINGTTTNTTLTANNWQLVTVTGSSFNSTSSLTIGKSSALLLNGFLDEVKLYGYTRTSAQIFADYDSIGSVKGSAANLGNNQQNNITALNQGLVGYWKMDEASWSGTNGEVKDSSKNGNDGTGNNSVTTTSGKFGNGGSFNGSNQYIQVTNSTSLSPTKGITISAWINLTSTTGGNYIVDKNSNLYNLSVQNSKAVFSVHLNDGGNAIATGTTTLTTAKWYHIVGTYNASTQKYNLYLNGNLEVSGSYTTNTTTMATGSGNLSIGCYLTSCSSTYAFNGTIDEVRIYNRDLSSADASNLYNFAPNPIVYYAFDENSGTSVTDSSGNGNNGTWIGTQTHWSTGKFGKSSANVVSGDYVKTTLGSSVSSGNISVSFWAKDTTDNTWHYYTQSGSSTYYKDGVSVSSFNKYFYLSGQSLVVGLGGKAPDDSSLSSNLSAWQKGDSINAANNAAISTWSDSSSNGNSFTYNNGYADQPTYLTSAINNRPGVKFTTNGGQGTGLVNTGSLANVFSGSNKASSVFDVFKRSSDSPTVDILSASRTDANPTELEWRLDQDVVPDGNDGQYAYAKNVSNGSCCLRIGGNPYSDQDKNAHIFTTVDSGTTANLYIDSSNSLANMTSSGSYLPTDVRLGFMQGSNIDNFSGNMGELLIYNTNLSSSDRRSIEAYLACKYNITTFVAAAYSCFTGQMDDFKVYNYVKTQQQVIQDMNAGHPTVGGSIEGRNGTPVGYWPFDEGYGTTANNIGSQEYTATQLNGTLSGTTTPTWTNSAKFGKALSFNGTTAYVTMNNPSALQITGALTLSAWINLTTNNANHDIIAKRGASGQFGYRLWVNSSGNPVFDVSSDGTTLTSATSTTVLSTGKWYHISGVYNPSTSLTLYINGNQDTQNTTTIPASIQNSSANLEIGSENGGGTNRMSGTIDEVKIYNFNISSNQVLRDMNRDASMILGALSSNNNTTDSGNAASQIYCVPGDTSTSCGVPKGEWNFEENTSTAVNDTTGNLNTGTWNDSVSDTFTRANSTTTLGNSETGQAWTALAGTWGIRSNQAYQPSLTGTNTYVVVNTGLSDGDISVQIQRRNGSVGMVFRESSSTSLYYITTNGGGGSLHKVNGSDNPVTLSSGSIPSQASDNSAHTWRVNLNGSNITIYLDGTQRATYVDSFNKTATGHGIYDNNSSATDNSYDNFTATNTTTTTSHWVPGKIGSAGNFDGTDDYVSVLTNSSLAPSSLTAEAWVYPTARCGSSCQNTIVGKFNTEWEIAVLGTSSAGCGTDNALLVYIGGTLNNYCGTTVIPLNTWTHIAVTYDGSNIKAYINGALDTIKANSAGITNGSHALSIGASTGSTSFFQGKIDQVRVYNYVRNVPQIDWDYNRGAPVGLWRFNECQGTIIHDSSGNSYNATWQGGTSLGTCTDGTGTTAWSAGKNGKYSGSLNFNGTNDYLTTTSFSPLETVGQNTTSASWGGWFYPTSSSASKSLFEKTSEFQLITNSSSQPICGVYYSGAFHNSSAPTTALVLNTWNHVMCTYDGTNINTYINGILVNQSAETNNITTSSSILYIAESSAGANMYSGQIDTIRIYNYALTSTQVKTVYNEGSAVRFGPTTGNP